MSRKQLSLNEEHARTVENALDAVDADPELPNVNRGRGRPADGEISTGGGRRPDCCGVHRLVGGWSR